MLTNDRVQNHKLKGFCVCPRLLTDKEVTELLREMDDICAGATIANHEASRLEMEPNQGPQGNKVRRIHEPCTYYEAFRELAESPKLVDSMVQLLGPDVLYSYSKINIKPAEIGSVVDWHQDMAYGPLTNSSYEAVLIYLDDADVENGCLRVIPGCSHMLDHSLDGYFQGRITEPFNASDSVAIEGERGTAVFFSGLTPHASSINKSLRSRRTLIIGYRSADAFPVYIGPMTVKADQFVRLVHGKASPFARFDMNTVAIPRYPGTMSLYELQELSRNRVQSEPQTAASNM
jgi:phytanoyl-CoA hydroxylase